MAGLIARVPLHSLQVALRTRAPLMGAGLPLRAMELAAPRVAEATKQEKETAQTPLLLMVALIVKDPQQSRQAAIRTIAQ